MNEQPDISSSPVPAAAPQVPTLRVYTCEHCHRAFTTAGAPEGMVIQISTREAFGLRDGDGLAVAPEIFECGREDCGLIVQENRKLDHAQEQRRKDGLNRWKAKHQPVDWAMERQRHGKRQSCAPVPARPQREASLPYKDAELGGPIADGVAMPGGLPTREPMIGTTAGYQPAVRTEAEARALLDGSAEDRLFQFLTGDGRLNAWVSNREIEQAIGRCRLNSVAARLRQRLADEGGEYELPEALHKPGEAQEVWYYQIVKKQLTF